MVARNDITGDKIQTRNKLSEKGAENFDTIFGVKKKTNGGWVPPPIETHRILRQETKWENPPITFDENRIDVIGQNGNDGEHYDQVEETKPTTD